MKRFILLLCLSLFASTAHAVLVPRVETVYFRTGTADTAYFSAGAAQTQFTSIPIRTKLFGDANALGFFGGSSGSSITDSTAMVIFRLKPLSGSATTVSADSVYWGIQFSADGVTWGTWSPSSSAEPIATSMLGSNKSVTSVEVGTSNCFIYVLRQANVAAVGYPLQTAAGHVTVSAVTSARGWMGFPFIRVVIQGDMGGQYELQMRYWADVPGRILRERTRLDFRTTGSAFPSLYADSAYAAGVGATVSDTLAPFSADLLQVPQPISNTVGADSLAFATLTVAAVTTSSTTPASFDSVYVTMQATPDGSNWSTIGTMSPPELASMDQVILPIKIQGLLLAGAYNGTLVPARGNTGSSYAWNSIYGAFPLIRFIITRDATFTGEIGAWLDYFRYQP